MERWEVCRVQTSVMIKNIWFHLCKTLVFSVKSRYFLPVSHLFSLLGLEEHRAQLSSPCPTASLTPQPLGRSVWTAHPRHAHQNLFFPTGEPQLREAACPEMTKPCEVAGFMAEQD